MVGFVGRTGTGKTTAVDLILGLLEPTAGQLLVDGMPITSAKKRAWQRSVGYVPQHIFIADDTVAANIASPLAHLPKRLIKVPWSEPHESRICTISLPGN
jgi:ABC-type multidrug transport system fused ATPase/permease subunit